MIEVLRCLPGRGSFPGSWVCLTRVLICVCAFTKKSKGVGKVSPDL